MSSCCRVLAQGIDGSLRSLGVDALDLVQFYWHDYSVPRYVGAAQRLQVAAPVLQHLNRLSRERLASIAESFSGIRHLP